MTIALHAAADWPAVASALADRTDLAAADLRALLDQPNPVLPPPVAAFTVLAAACDSATMRTILGEHSGHPDRLAGWLTRTARIALRTYPKPDPPIDVPHPIGPVHVDPAIGRLDLLTLANDQAWQRMRPLIVRPVHLGPLATGRHRRAAPATIHGRHTLVDVIDLNPDAADPYGTWLHELAHYLDPRLDRRSPEESERFADTLAVPLAAEYPLYLEQAQPLIAAADARSTHPAPAAPTLAATAAPPSAPTSTLTLPAEGIDSLAALVNLPLTPSPSVT